MSRSRQKGTAAESAVVAYLQSVGFPYAERRALSGANDRGDVAGVPGTFIEVKNAARTELAEWVKEITAKRDRNGGVYAAVWHKKRGAAFPGNWFVTMSGAEYVALLKAALGIED